MKHTVVGLAALLMIQTAHAEPADSYDNHRRAGFGPATARFAKPSDTGRYTGYYVGGGAPMGRGEAPLAHDGTWGWDYRGGQFRRRVILNWWHGRRYQGGPGAYRTDGPKALPPVER
ncbi:MAG: hypothetical protein L0Y71_05055 [Gemmataceae bacterium]|nr:hypothetical protein [Gemmataceae bacterium]